MVCRHSTDEDRCDKNHIRSKRNDLTIFYYIAVYLLFGGTRKTLYLLVALGLAKISMDVAIIWTYHLERVRGYRMGPTGRAPLSVIYIFTQVPLPFSNMSVP